MRAGSATLGPVLVGWVDTSSVRGRDPAIHRLGPAQSRRLAALPASRAHRFAAGRGLLAALADELAPGADLTLTTVCERCGAEHGRPRFERVPIAASIAYAGEMAAVAVVRHADAAAVGVDIERIPIEGERAPLAALTRLFAPAPPPDTREWTLLEAAVKADGRGLDLELAAVRIGAERAGTESRTHAVRTVTLPGRSTPLQAATLPAPAGYVLSAATAPAAGERHPSANDVTR